MFDQIQQLRVHEKLSLGEIVERLSCSRGTASKYVRQAEAALSPEQRHALRMEIGGRSRADNDPDSSTSIEYQYWQASRELEKLKAVLAEKTPAPLAESLSAVERGQVAERFVTYQLARRGFYTTILLLSPQLSTF